eukprot:scaffold1_cov402-Prasinococcus_capsulatus_cf.AAC.79
MTGWKPGPKPGGARERCAACRWARGVSPRESTPGRGAWAEFEILCGESAWPGTVCVFIHPLPVPPLPPSPGPARPTGSSRGAGPLVVQPPAKGSPFGPLQGPKCTPRGPPRIPEGAAARSGPV